MAHLGLPRHEQRVGEKRRRVLRSPPLDRDLRAAQQRQRLPRDGPDLPMQPGPFGEVAVGVVEPPGEDRRLAAQGEGEGMAAGGADPLGLGGEVLRERDDLVVGQAAVGAGAR